MSSLNMALQIDESGFDRLLDDLAPLPAWEARSPLPIRLPEEGGARILPFISSPSSRPVPDSGSPGGDGAAVPVMAPLHASLVSSTVPDNVIELPLGPLLTQEAPPVDSRKLLGVAIGFLIWLSTASVGLFLYLDWVFQG